MTSILLLKIICPKNYKLVELNKLNQEAASTSSMCPIPVKYERCINLITLSNER